MSCQGECGNCKCKSLPIVDRDTGDESWPPNNEGRYFESGAYRDTDADKLDFEGFFSPVVLGRRAEYMHKHRVQSNGELRDSDNWQQGIPKTEYMKSMWRHFFDVWALHRMDLQEGSRGLEDLEEALCALMFNCEGYLFELLAE